jgi:hypothetical protein
MNAIFDLLAGECPELALAGAEHAPVRARGIDATIVYRPNRDEQQRRKEVGLDGVTRLDQLDVMMQLPAGIPVPLESLSITERHLIQRLPHGCVTHTDAGVVRLLTRPLQVKLAIVTTGPLQTGFWSLQAGLKRAGRFAPYCNRVLAIPGEPRDLHQAATEADYWGIGLVVNTAHEPRLVVAPELFVQRRHTPAGWFFLEEVHQQVTTLTTAR